MKRLLKRLADRLMSSATTLRGLERIVHRAQVELGIGAGTSVGTSGETGLFRELRRKKAGARELCLFDVGANRGEFLDLALSHLKPIALSIHCFEPSAATFKMLADGRQVDTRINLNQFGLGKAKGEFTLYYDQPGSGLASLTNRRLELYGMKFGLSERVQIDTLDGYCKERGIEHIDLLKMDVEGHELDVLQGGERMLAGSVDMVSFEFGCCNIDTRTYVQDFYRFFQQRGMQLYRITSSGFLYPIPKYSEHLEQFRTTNFLAMRGV